MRLNKLILIVLSFMCVFNVNASDLIMEPHAMLYYQVPLGGGNKQKHKSTFGFRFDNAIHETGKQIDYQRLFNQEPVLDFRLNNDGVEAFKITGIDYLKKYRLLRQNGDNVGDSPENAADSTDNSEGEAVQEEEESLLDKLPGINDIVEEDQYFGLLLGALIATGFAFGL